MIYLLIALLALAPAHTTCLVENLPTILPGPGNGYAPATKTIYLETRKPNIAIHEYAHHIDFTCGAHKEIAEALVASQNLSPDTPWYGQGHPTTWPAEYFANAVLLNYGYTTRHNVTPETVALVYEWLTKEET
jgi:hypothetical protein